MLEIAPEFKAMVVFVEHRYYGDSWTNGSWPFGTNAFQPENLRYLTVEQALADFVEVRMTCGSMCGSTTMVGGALLLFDIGNPSSIVVSVLSQTLDEHALQVTLSLRELMKAPPETAVVTFGGSYGANLAMWSRLKVCTRLACQDVCVELSVSVSEG